MALDQPAPSLERWHKLLAECTCAVCGAYLVLGAGDGRRMIMEWNHLDTWKQLWVPLGHGLAGSSLCFCCSDVCLKRLNGLLDRLGKAKKK